MGLLDDLLATLSPEARKRLAKEAAARAVKGVGDAVYEKVDQVREDVAAAATARREAKERVERDREKVREAARDAEAIEDELAALKKKLGR